MKLRAFYAVILSAICILTTNISYAATDYSISRKVEIVLDSKRDNALSYLKSRISTINLTLNGKRVRNSDIYFRNNELMLPIRNVAEAFNLDLSWDSKQEQLPWMIRLSLLKLLPTTIITAMVLWLI